MSRPHGSPNRKTQELHEICERHGVDVFEGMVLMAREELDPDKRFAKYESLAKYLYSQRKAIDPVDDNPFHRLTAKEKLEHARRAIPILEAEVKKLESRDEG